MLYRFFFILAIFLAVGLPLFRMLIRGCCAVLRAWLYWFAACCCFSWRFISFSNFVFLCCASVWKEGCDNYPLALSIARLCL